MRKLSILALAGTLAAGGLAAAMPTAALSADLSVGALTIDYETDPLGVDPSEALRFSWKIAAGAKSVVQKSYKIDVEDMSGNDIWSSGKVNNADSVALSHTIKALQPETKYTWKVTVNTNVGSATSSKGSFVTAADLTGVDWVMPAQTNGFAYLRTKKTLGSTAVESAYLYVTALGNYTAYIDGQEVKSAVDDIFNPGWTDYRYYVNYQTYDVAELISDTTLTLGLELSTGWYAGRISSLATDWGAPATPFYKSVFGPSDNDAELGALAKLVINYTDGSKDTISTDTDWKSTGSSPVLSNDLWDGESHDAQLETPGWNDDGFDDSTWVAPTVQSYSGKLVSSSKAAARIADELERPAVAAYSYNDAETQSAADAGNDTGAVVEHAAGLTDIALAAGEHLVVDFGQNAAGIPEFTVDGTAGTTLTLQYAEMLNDGKDSDGSGAKGSDGPKGSLYEANYKGLVGKRDTYTLKAGEQTWSPTHTFHGFRYMAITADANVTIKAVKALTITSVGEQTASITTNNQTLNQFVENTRWSQASNYLSILTDCPQRDERAGWTGDAQLFAGSAIYNYDVYSVLENFNAIMQAQAKKTGTFQAVTPIAYNSTFANRVSAGWSDAGIIIPWTLWQRTGDLSVARESFAVMDGYADWVYSNTTAYPTTSPHYGTSTSNGYDISGFGDWLAIEGASLEYMNDVYQLYTTQLMAQMSEALGKSSAKAKYEGRVSSLKASLISKWLDASGNLLTSTNGAGGAGTRVGYPIQSPIADNSQTGLLWALKLGLYNSDAERQILLTNLVKNLANSGSSVRAADGENTLAVGFLGVNVLLPVLADQGESEMAYNLLLQTNSPSWLYPVTVGATTTWERWDSYSDTGFGDASMNSFNHYSYGAAVEWVYQYLAGIDTDPENPGYANVVLHPTLDTSGRLTTVDAKFESIRGPIVSKYSSSGGAMNSYHAEIPANATATLYLPIGDEQAKLQVQDGVSYEGIVTYGNEQLAKFTLGSGSYDFDLSKTAAVDKTALESSVDQAEGLAALASQFSEDSWKTLSDALAAAKAIIANPAATAAEVSQAKAALDAAITGLKAKVPAAEPAPKPVVAKIKLNQSQLRLVKGKKLTLEEAVYYTDASVLPSYAGKVTWTSSNKKVATVNSNGVVKALKAGTATITVTTKELNAAGKNVSAKIKVTVVKKKPAAKVTKVSASVPKTLALGNSAYITGKYTSAKAAGVKVKYGSTKADIVLVDKAGRLVAVSKGTEYIKVTAGGKTKKYKITVK
ncbi:MAG: family 78 glycoside hydrolase catalytic domain [Propionibacteriaceae bacterium]|jgi:alpha-L-rhamnosidase|nr:family 78 glycoside hydrolase catalytic domain [Propionibacteriaceae bacterium]